MNHLRFLVFSFFVCINVAYTQLEKFNIEYPYQGDIAKLNVDSTGFIWFHDDKDFYKYNGHHINQVGLSKIIGKKNDDYFLYGQIIFVNGSILFLNDNKVSLIDPETKFIKDIWQLPGRNYFKYLYKDGSGAIWIFSSTWDNQSQPVYRSTDGTHFEEVFDMNDHVGEKGVFWTYFELDDKDGILYFLWRKGGMLMINKDGKEIELDVSEPESYLSTKDCAQFRLDNQKNLWRIYNTEFEIYDPMTKGFQKHSISGHIEFITDCKINDDKLNKRIGLSDIGSMLNLKYIYMDYQDRIWMACAASYLICFDPQTGVFTNFREPIVGELGRGDTDIEKLIEDDTHNLWGFKKGGIFKIRDVDSYFDSYLVNTKFSTHEIHSDKSNPTYRKIIDFYGDYAIRNAAIHSINEDSNGRLILQEGVFSFRLDPIGKELELLPIFAPKESVQITYTKDVKLFGVWDSYYTLDENFEEKKMKTPVLKLENTFLQMNGDLWVSGLLSNKSYLFAKMDSETFEFDGNYLDPSGAINFSINKIMDMAEDKKGNLWLGSLEGIILFDPKKNEFNFIGDTFDYEGDSIQIATIVNHVEYQGENHLWFATNFEIGLLDLNSRSLVQYLLLPAETAGKQIKMINDGDSVIWYGHSQGLNYYNFNNQISISMSEEEGINTDGAIHDVKWMSSGDIATATNNGLYIFDPDSLLQNYARQKDFQESMPMSLNSYSVIDGHTDTLLEYKFIQDTSHNIVLDYNDKMLQLEFSILNFDYPDRHRFSYKLEGYDRDWSDPTIENIAKYTSIPAGEYQFLAKGTSGSGIWSRRMVTVPITVKQAWFYSWWFILSVISFFALITYFVTRYYYQQQLAKRKAIEKLRNNISHDLHDDVGSILSGLAVRSEVMSLTSKGEIKTDLLEISEDSRIAMEKMRDIVWAINSERDKFENLVDRMRMFASSQFKHSTMDYEIDLQNIKGHTQISPDVKQNLYFIFKEAVTNAIKHSNGDKVWVYLLKENQQVVLRVKDNGTAIDLHSKEGIGLSSIQSRAKKINAKVFFYQDDGYEVRVEV